MNKIQLSQLPFPTFEDHEAVRVVGGAGMPMASFWRHLLTTVVEIGLEALLKEWRRHWQERQRSLAH